MLKSLRKRVVVLTMIAVLIVLIVLMGIINTVNYISRDNSIDEVLDFLAESGGNLDMFENHGHGGHGGAFGRPDNFDGELPGENPDGLDAVSPAETPSEDFLKDSLQNDTDFRFEGRPGLSAETPYETRFFTVTFDGSDNMIGVDISKIAAVAQEEAEEMALNAKSSGKESAYSFKENASYKYKEVETDNGTMYIFVDCSKEINSVKSFLLTSILVSIGGLIAIGILVILLSPTMIKPIAESYEKQKKFITNAGHELKTPLAVIESCTEVMELESGESKWTEAIKEQVGKMSHLTGNLVSLAKMDEAADNSGELPMEELNFSSLVNETLEPFTLMADQKGLTINKEIEPGLKFKGNKASLTELVNILADNAIKYARKSGGDSSSPDILFTLKQRGKHIVLTEENSAEGLTQGSMNVLFDRFYRGDQSHNKEEIKVGGYGIGLSMALAIVNAHGGKISADSPDGEKLLIEAEF